MKKIFIILKREYYSRVKKKSFLLTTILVPLVIMAFYAAIIFISLDENPERQKIAVIDEGKLFDGVIETDSSLTTFILVENETESSFVKKYKEQGFQSFLYIPAFQLDQPGKFIFHSPSAASITTLNSVEKMANKALRNKRLSAMGISAET
ncbi:MAG: ABC transporter permease, partial [Ferruginibacter sp.]|nr:ABC transporter permease [Ferruginibacter sp.]